MTVTINGTTGVTYPAGGTDNVAGAGVGTTDAQTLTNKTLTNPTITGGSVAATSGPDSTQLAGNRNKIINGAMMIDQRNAGAEISGNDLWPLDRFNVSSASGVVFKGQRVADAPAGFANSIKITQSTQGGVTYKLLQHYIEGFNIADFGFGTASAKPFVVSFWVKASITGNYSIVFQNAAGGASRLSYATTYTVSAANTWEFKTIVAPGNTSGTWYTDNQRGLGVLFDIGSTGYETTTTNSWINANALRVTGTVDLSANTGATLQITGVQLEKGATATPFENRLYGTELALCQRYYQTSYPIGVALQALTNVTDGATFICINTSDTGNGGPLPVSMRATPTFATYSSNGSVGANSAREGASGSNITAITLAGGTTNNLPRLSKGSGFLPAGNVYTAHWTANAEL